MSYFKNICRQVETARKNKSIKTLKQLLNTPLTGSEHVDLPILDAALDFIALKSTKMSDKIAAARYVAPIVGEDPETINEAYVLDMLGDSEEASTKKSKMRKYFANKK